MLGDAMSSLPPDEPSDGLDPEESGIPALYTYFGQFVDHDLTFDPVSTLRKSLDPDALVDFRTPSFNLDNVYGRGPEDQPYMYDKRHRFHLGDAISAPGAHNGNDLPRFEKRAIIGDPRNDENSLVSQLQGLFLKIHNRMMDDNKDLDFGEVQQLVRFYYQYVVVNDLLSRIVNPRVLDSLKSDGHYDSRRLRYYHPHKSAFMPVEFSVAAYRLGHSMVRPGYRLNDGKLLPIFPHHPPEGPDEDSLTGFEPLDPKHTLDWGRFIDIDRRPGGSTDKNDPDNKRRLQFAYRIDTSLIGFLHHLPHSIASDHPASLAERNLLRGWDLGLPSGQSVARAMGVPEMTDDQIVIGKAVDSPEDGDVKGNIVDVAGAAFAGNCPLWTYILAEAADPENRTDMPLPTEDGGTRPTPQLGPVGGRIVAEVFLGLLFADGSSYLLLDPLWTPPKRPDFRLKDLVAYALGEGDPLHYR
jgi:hypothetical protein